MATLWRGYFFVEDIGLTADQRSTLVSALRAWGLRNDSLLPNERNHWAVRPDGLAVIFEAVFDADNLTAIWFRTKLSQIFSVSLTSVTATVATTTYGTLATFKYLTTSKLRMGIFGGLTATWDQSHDAVLKYLAAYASLWKGVKLP